MRYKAVGILSGYKNIFAHHPVWWFSTAKLAWKDRQQFHITPIPLLA